ncbi:MAG: pyridoxal-phosphate dependent enzyme [Planctomycetota bacterium]|jgi:1-aminocyclopropane-1-carboxylate deaminase/D-cysteine desulfhydrase-like pyridoxal-dependent ACC family enzyme
MIPSVERMPRLPLGYYPTPMTDAKMLSKVLGGPRILIKREDLSGLVLGGNKCRYLEFLMGYVKEKGFDIILCGKRGNYRTQLSAAANKVGIKVKFYSIRGSPATSGNLLLQDLLDSDIIWLDTDIGYERTSDLPTRVLNDVQRLQQEGHRPYVMQPLFADVSPIEITGWVNAADEIYEQLTVKGITADYLVIASARGGTQSGLVVGMKYLQASLKVIGICVMHSRDWQIGELVRMTNETAKFLNLGIKFTSDEIIVYDEYRGKGYGVVSNECVEAIRLVAQTEGILLDPVYTGKAMAGLIDLIRKGRFTSNDTVVFMHTGGVPDIFSYGKQLIKSEK